MKKIITRLFIALCVILPANTLADTKKVNNEIKNNWLPNGVNYLNQNNGTKVNHKIYHNNTYDFDYVNIPAAINIYKNGAKICLTILQNNYKEWKAYVVEASCKTFCEDGWYGNSCENTSTNNTQCDNTNLTNIFKDDDNTIKQGHDEETIDTLAYGTGGITILAATQVSTHEIIITPMTFETPDNHSISTIWIGQNNPKPTLCAPGYEKKDGVCTATAACSSNQNNETDDGSCPITKLSGPSSDGTCRHCTRTLEIYDTNTKDCVDVKPITKEKMRNCAKEHHNLTDVINCIKD